MNAGLCKEKNNVQQEKKIDVWLSNYEIMGTNTSDLHLSIANDKKYKLFFEKEGKVHHCFYILLNFTSSESFNW